MIKIIEKLMMANKNEKRKSKMNLENVHNKLLEKKLGILEYFQVAFDIFRVILKENKLLILVAFFIIGARIVITGLEYKYVDYSNVSEESFDVIVKLAIVFDTLNFIIFIISVVFSGYFHRVVALKIENRENEMYLKDFSLKMLNLIGLIVCVKIFLEIFGFLGMFGTVVAMFCVVMFLCLSIGMLLYFEVYYIRDIGFMDSIDYSLRLCDKNRLRKIIPNVIFGVGITVFYYIILKIFIMNIFAKILISAVLVLILALIGIYTYALDTVIFLNIEYDYFKNYENKQFNFKNERKVDENHIILDKFLSSKKNKIDKNK